MAHDLIEELIEESYLLSLSEPDIRSYLTRFIEACDTVVNERLNGRNDLRIIGAKVALLRARVYVHAQSSPSKLRRRRDPAIPAGPESLVDHVLETKRAIRRLFDSIDPSLMETVEDIAKRRRESPAAASKRAATAFRTPLVYKLGYAGLAFLATGMLLVYLAC